MQFIGERIGTTKTVRDPIYGFIEVPEPLLRILDHKLFQRLRWVNQLPLEQLVYPSAQHSRFEHSPGTMWLTLCVASYLHKNSKKFLQKILKDTPEFSGLSTKESLEHFYLAAACAGLLHDVGHAPFSHTLEDAYGYTEQSDHYSHEKVGFHVSMKILEDLELDSEPFALILRKVLNKELSYANDNLDDLPHVIRQLVDGPIDVDKGDYVLRDSYHCGVTYGVYDYARLWMNVVLTSDSVVGVNAKGAVEAWSLRVARFRMHAAVYKHKIRNITDALLIQILARAFQLADGTEKLKKIVPVDLASPLRLDEEVVDFTFWSDANFVASLFHGFDDNYIRTRIQDYQKRSLGKLLKEYNLVDYPGLTERALSRLKRSLMQRSVTLDESRISFSSIIYKPVKAPVFEKEVQERIRVFENNHSKESRSLAEFLGFEVDPNLLKDQSGYFLQIFGSENQKEEILKVVDKELQNYSQF